MSGLLWYLAGVVSGALLTLAFSLAAAAALEPPKPPKRRP